MAVGLVSDHIRHGQSQLGCSCENVRLTKSVDAWDGDLAAHTSAEKAVVELAVELEVGHPFAVTSD